MSKQPAPQSIEGFHQRLREVSEDLPKRMKQCAEYLAANSSRIAVSTVAEMAGGAQVQPSAMMRFCQMLGFSGYSEMQRLFRDSISRGFPDYSSRLISLQKKGAGSPSALLAEFVDAGRLSLENLASTIDSRALDEAVATLSDAEMIHLVGLRRAFPVATYLAYALEKMNIPSMLHDGVGLMNQAHALRTGDVLLAATFAPYSAETVAMVQSCVARDLPVVAITDTVISPVQIRGVLPLTVSETDFGAFRSLSATLSLAITLAVAVGTRKGVDTTEFQG